MSVVTHVRGRETWFWGVIIVCNCVCARLCSVAAALVWAVRSCVVGACGPAASDASDPAAAAAPWWAQGSRQRATISHRAGGLFSWLYHLPLSFPGMLLFLLDC